MATAGERGRQRQGYAAPGQGDARPHRDHGPARRKVGTPQPDRGDGLRHGTGPAEISRPQQEHGPPSSAPDDTGALTPAWLRPYAPCRTGGRRSARSLVCLGETPTTVQSAATHIREREEP